MQSLHDLYISAVFVIISENHFWDIRFQCSPAFLSQFCSVLPPALAYSGHVEIYGIEVNISRFHLTKYNYFKKPRPIGTNTKVFII